MCPSNDATGPGPGPRWFRFDDVVVDAHGHTLERGGEPCTVEPKAFSVLVELLRHPGELVTRDELLDRVWGHRHVTPGVLTRAIAQLRHALADDPHEPRYIRTRHTLGYCFIAPLVQEVEEVAQAPAAHAVDVPVAPPAGPDTPRAPVPIAVAGAPPSVDGPPGFGHRSPPEPTTPVPGAAQVVDPPARPAWMWLATVVLLGTLAVLGWWVQARQDVATGRDRVASVAVLPFDGAGGPEDAYFARGLSAELREALAGVPGLRAVEAGAADARRDARVVGHRLDAGYVLRGRVERSAGRVRIDAALLDADTGRTRWSQRFESARADVFALQASLADGVVRQLLGEPGGQGLVRRLAPTRSAEAYDAYLRGAQQLAGGEGGAGLDRATAAFGEALRLDPTFARAQAGLCRAEIRRFEDALSAAAFGRAEAACRRAAAMGPELRDVDLALGDMYRIRGDSVQAVRHFTRALDDVALRPLAYVGLARVRAAMGQPALARQAFDAALRLSPNDANIHREVGYSAYLAGDLPRAIAAYRRAARLAPDDERLWSSLGGLLLASGDDAGASAAFERSLAARPNHAALSNYGSLRYETRDYARAAELFRKAAALQPDDFRTWGNLGDALAAEVATAAAAAEPYRRARALAERYVSIRGDDAQALALLAWYRANLGDADGAREALRRAGALGTEPGEVAFLGAQVMARLGDASAARRYVVDARARDITERRLDASPLLRPLLDGRGPLASRQ